MKEEEANGWIKMKSRPIHFICSHWHCQCYYHCDFHSQSHSTLYTRYCTPYTSTHGRLKRTRDATVWRSPASWSWSWSWSWLLLLGWVVDHYYSLSWVTTIREPVDHSATQPQAAQEHKKHTSPRVKRVQEAQQDKNIEWNKIKTHGTHIATAQF